MAKKLKKLCPSLEALYISYDQIFQVELLKSVPSTLTHLSLPYCNLSAQNFRAIFNASLIDATPKDIREARIMDEKAELCCGKSEFSFHFHRQEITTMQ